MFYMSNWRIFSFSAIAAARRLTWAKLPERSRPVGGDRAKAAEELQVSAKTLLAKMREYELTDGKGGGHGKR